MKRYVLDTNVVSELRKRKPHGAVLAWFTALRDEQIFLSAVTLAELQSGIELTREQDPDKAREIEQWVDKVEVSYQVLAMDGSCVREWSRLMHHKSEDLIEDGMIAATARLHNLVVATRNTADFRDLKVDVFNPFTE